MALVMLVSVNVLTSISYAQEESEILEPENVDEPWVTKMITYDADNWIIKLKYDEDEIRIKDKNVWAENPTMTWWAYQLMQLVYQMCHLAFPVDASLNVAVSEAPELTYICDEGFATMATDIAGVGISTYNDAINYINSHYDMSPNAYWHYYRWGNDWYASYDELSCQENDEYLWVESLNDDGCYLDVATDAVERWFMDGYNYNNYWWYQWDYDNPCDASKWEYLPGPSDRERLIDMRGYINDTPTLVEMNLRNHRIYSEDVYQFMSDLMVPHAGYVGIFISPKLASTINGDPLVYKNYYDSLWTAHWYDSYYYRTKWRIWMNSEYWAQYYDDIWGMATPVRCFVATDPVTLTFKFNNWQPDKVLKIQRWNWIGEPEYSQKDGSVFDWWYVGDEEYYFEENVEQDLTIEAHWTECGDWQVVKNNKCVYEVEHDVDRWLLKVTDGERTVYIKDRNVWAKVSAWLDKGNKIRNIVQSMCNVPEVEKGVKSVLSFDLGEISCPDEVKWKIAEILWVSEIDLTENYLNNYMNAYYYLYDEDYIASFWNYYYRGNDNYATYTWLGIQCINPNAIPTSLETTAENWMCSISSPESFVLEFANPDNNEWNNSLDADNPCSWIWEYLPSAQDWQELMDIWAYNNVFYTSELRDKDEAYVPSTTYIPYKYVLQFQEDLLIPSAWSLLYRCADVTASLTASDSPCNLYYDADYANLRASKDGNWYGYLYGGRYDGWYLDDINRDSIANPVRCFVNIDARTHTITFDTAWWTSVAPITQEYNTTIEAAPQTTKAWYIFDGWYDGDTKVSFPYTVSWDKTLVAHWTENKWNGYSWWWWGSSSKPNTEQVDKQHNAADEETKKAEPEIKKEEWKNIKIITNAPINTEKETFNAHQWAYSKWLTKYRTSSEARMDDFLNRSEMAKISSIFATEFLDKTPDTKKKEFCSQYSDMWKVEDDMKFFIAESCELWYMWYESNGVDALERFRPYTPLTVAETATILSRIVWWNENAMNGKDWYKWHLYATYNYGLIDDIEDPTTRSITRREAYTMLYRLINMME